MKQAEAVVHSSNRIDVLFDAICCLGLDQKQSPVRLKQRSHFSECLLRCRKIMNAVASGDQIETITQFNIARGARQKANALSDTCACGTFAGFSNGLKIGVEANDFTFGKSLRNCNANTANAAANIKNAAATLQSCNDIG